MALHAQARLRIIFVLELRSLEDFRRRATRDRDDLGERNALIIRRALQLLVVTCKLAINEPQNARSWLPAPLL